MQNALPKPEEMTSSAVREVRKILLSSAKRMNVYPRSPWHMAYEHILHIDVGSWATIEREHEITEEPPRIDFIVLRVKRFPANRKGIYKIFRKQNIIEYKRPGDLITERKIRKNAGYAGLLIGETSEKQYQIDQITITMFGSSFSEKDKASMIARGLLESTDTPGVYMVKGITDYPYQIIVDDELADKLTDNGKDDYSLYRVLSDHADVEDVKKVLSMMQTETAENQDRLRNVLNVVEDKNPGKVADMIREDRENMKDVFMEVFAPEIEEKIDNALVKAIKGAIKNFHVSPQQAMEGLEIPENKWSAYAAAVAK